MYFVFNIKKKHLQRVFSIYYKNAFTIVCSAQLCSPVMKLYFN